VILATLTYTVCRARAVAKLRLGDPEQYLRAFAAGHFHLLILVGSGGLAKSRSVRAVLNGQACWIEGNATPFGMCVQLNRHRDQFASRPRPWAAKRLQR
jgi:hypothetical protein